MTMAETAAAPKNFYPPAGCGVDFFRAITVGSTMGEAA